MLETLLKIIRSGGTWEARTLATRLGVSHQMVAVMLEHLHRSGYLRPYIFGTDGCAGCNVKSSCCAEPCQDQLRLWQGGL